MEGIDEKTNLNELTKKLLELNQKGKLGLPLVGSLEATLFLYRAAEGSNDITETFRATILPPRRRAPWERRRNLDLAWQIFLEMRFPTVTTLVT